MRTLTKFGLFLAIATSNSSSFHSLPLFSPSNIPYMHVGPFDIFQNLKSFLIHSFFPFSFQFRIFTFDISSSSSLVLCPLTPCLPMGTLRTAFISGTVSLISSNLLIFPKASIFLHLFCICSCMLFAFFL